MYQYLVMTFIKTSTECKINTTKNGNFQIRIIVKIGSPSR